MSNLLVVDWDFFFPNPIDGGDHQDPWLLLYDWSHAETPYYIEMPWLERAAGFLANGLDLPRCAGYTSFWPRFRITDGAGLLIADSNAWAGLLRPDSLPDTGTGPPGFDHVWLFDAHHDCGYRTTLDQWRRAGSISCEDWMLVHHERGSALHVRYPPWKVHASSVEPAPAVTVDRAVDDGSCPVVEFDTVFVCRSGAWVPAWNDDQFDEFLRSFPGPVRQLDGARLRQFDTDTAADLAQLRSERFARLREHITQPPATGTTNPVNDSAAAMGLRGVNSTDEESR